MKHIYALDTEDRETKIQMNEVGNIQVCVLSMDMGYRRISGLISMLTAKSE
jgi:hypothetical protein